MQRRASTIPQPPLSTQPHHHPSFPQQNQQQNRPFQFIPGYEDNELTTSNNHKLLPTKQLHHQQRNQQQQQQQHWSTSSWSDRWRYCSYYLPIAKWLPNYDFKNDIWNDLSAGLSVAAVLVPQSMAYASILSLPPIFGLLTALSAAIVYFIFGHSRLLSVGPQAATSILLNESVMSIPMIKKLHQTGQPIPMELILSGAGAITFMAGLTTLIFGLFRLGFVDGVFSRPVLSGLICGVGLQLLTDQTPKILGIKTCPTCSNSIQKLHYLSQQIFIERNINIITTCIGISCILYLFFFKSFKAKYATNQTLQTFPHIFFLVAIVTAISYIFNLHDIYNVATIGNQAGVLPTPHFPQLFFQNNFGHYVTHGIILAVLTFVETQIVNKAVVIRNAPSISPNRELIALGLMHMFTSIAGGYIACGSLARTKVVAASGGKSQLTNAVSIVLLFFAIFFLMPVFSYLPYAVAGAIVFFVATGLVETHETIFTFHTKQWTDFVLNVAMVLITYIFGVDTGLFFAFAICLLLVIKQQNKPSVRLLGRFGTHLKTRDSALDLVDHNHTHSPTKHDHIHHNHTHTHTHHHHIQHPHHQQQSLQQHQLQQQDLHQQDQFIEFKDSIPLQEVVSDGILIYQIDGPLFFCNAENLKERLRRIEIYGTLVSHPSQDPKPLTPFTRGVIFDLQSVTSIDPTGLSVLIEIVKSYHQNNIMVIFVKLRKSLLPLFIDGGLTDLVGMKCFKRSIASSVEYIDSIIPPKQI